MQDAAAQARAHATIPPRGACCASSAHADTESGFLSLPLRAQKPRSRGLTQVMDQGLTLAEVEGLFEVAGSYVDLVKLGWGTSYVTGNLDAKLALYRKLHCNVNCGGTLFEAAYLCGKLDAYRRWLLAHEFTHVEVSDGTIWLAHEDKLEAIEMLSRDFIVLSEVGRKRDDAMDGDDWARQMSLELEAGAKWVIAEGRETGTAGIYHEDGRLRADIVEKVLEAVDPNAVIFEAPAKAAQAWLIKRLGPDVNLGNVSPRHVIALETLRLGLRADTLMELLPGQRPT